MKINKLNKMDEENSNDISINNEQRTFLFEKIARIFEFSDTGV